MSEQNGQLPTFGEWCDLHRMNPDNDDNYELYCKWLEREKKS